MRGALAGLALALAAGSAAGEERRTGYDDMAPELRAMQDDRQANPGLFWALDGERLYAEPAGTAQTSCRDCHGPAPTAMAGVAARYPAWDEEEGRAVDLAGRINLCRARHQGAAPLDRGDDALLSLTLHVTLQSAGAPIAPDPDPRLDRARARGEALFAARMGQLNLACADCHADNAGRRLLAATIPQAHPTGYPQYRLQWETMGSLHRRFGNCISGVRAEPLAPGDPALVALELYLMERAAGLPLESLPIRP